MARGILGKALKGVASVAVPAALENQRAEIMRLRDETLNNYNKQNMQAQQQYATSERVAGQEFQREMAEPGNIIASETLKLNQRQTDAAIKASEAQLREAGLKIEELEDYRKARQAFMQAPPEKKNDAYIDYMMTTRQYTAPDSKDNLSVQKIDRIDDAGNVIGQDIMVVNLADRTMEKIEVAEGAPIPTQAHIDLLLSDPSPEAMLEFDQEFKSEGLAERLLKAKEGSAPASAPAPAPAVAPAGAQTTPPPSTGTLAGSMPGGGSPEPVPDILAAFTQMENAPNPRGAAMQNTGTDTSAPRGRIADQMQAGERAADRRKTEAASAMKALLDQGKLPSTAVPRQTIIDAIESGTLSAEEVAVLNAYLQRRDN